VLSREELLEGLTPPQAAAASHVDGPLLIIAGAGSGKTRVLTRRVAHLIAIGIPPASILAITFTNKAAGEMKERVGHVLGHPLRDIGRLDQRNPMICTFHSLCMRILRHYGSRIGVPDKFTVYDSSDQTKVVKDALKTLEISSQNFSPSQVHHTISGLKNQLITPNDLARTATAFYEKNVARIYGKYQAMLEANNALDFDDLIMKVVHGMRNHPDVLAELQDRFQYILIDEYQDTNKAQYFLAHTLAAKHKNICVVGDPDQSIYAWRGADIQNILDFERDYTNATVVRLEQNYRSTKTILKLASDLIARNTQRKDKGLWTENAQGVKAHLYVCQTEADEAQVVVDEFKALHDKQNRPWSEMAVFYRMNSISRVIEEKLMAARIPYQVARGVEFYNRKEIKDVLSYLRVLVNPADEVSLERIINSPTRGISDETVRKFQLYGISSGMTLYQALGDAHMVQGLTARAQNAVRAFVAMIDRLRQLAAQSTANNESIFFEEPIGTVQKIMTEVVEQTGIRANLEKSTDPDKPELANVKELINSAATYDNENPEGTLDDYLAQISLMSDVDKLRDGGGAVTLMTLHAAKGLEFPVVAMIGMEEGILPHARARTDPTQMEEERRLAFVGITRAQEQLLFSRAYARTLMGRRERTVPSPFLTEMPQELIDVTDRTDNRFQAEDDNDVDFGGFRRGQTVRHATFGIGRIEEIHNMGHNTRAVIDFARAGRKTLILEYAGLQAMS
jgi:DNA helicase II / ATP-dependent DNA helicase PcrA